LAPTKIMIIRHGEKAKDFPGDPNINREGEPDDASLNSQGWRRAQALVGFFVDADPPGIATPDIIFAAAPDQDSARPMETVTPLAERLWPDPTRGQHFITTYAVGETDKLVEDVMQRDGVCLICWEHHAIPAIAAALPPYVPASPSLWSGHRFDVVWVFDPHKHAWSFSQTAQNLLVGDLNRPMKNKDP
jgi:broad specificity phosphatase PhoE